MNSDNENQFLQEKSDQQFLNLRPKQDELDIIDFRHPSLENFRGIKQRDFQNLKIKNKKAESKHEKKNYFNQPTLKKKSFSKDLSKIDVTEKGLKTRNLKKIKRKFGNNMDSGDFADARLDVPKCGGQSAEHSLSTDNIIEFQSGNIDISDELKKPNSKSLIKGLLVAQMSSLLDNISFMNFADHDAYNLNVRFDFKKYLNRSEFKVKLVMPKSNQSKYPNSKSIKQKMLFVDSSKRLKKMKKNLKYIVKKEKQVSSQIQLQKAKIQKIHREIRQMSHLCRNKKQSKFDAFGTFQDEKIMKIGEKSFLNNHRDKLKKIKISPIYNFKTSKIKKEDVNNDIMK